MATAGTSKAPPPYYVKALALGVPAYLIGIHLWTWVFTVSIFLGGDADFRPFYATGYMVRVGHSSEVYDYAAQYRFQNEVVSHTDIALPFIHPAYEALLFVPLSFVRYRTAYLLFLLFNVLLLVATYLLLRSLTCNLWHVYAWLPIALFLAFLPVAAALIQGQDSILLLTLLAAATVLLNRGHELRAGTLVGIGLFKFQLTIPIALLFLIWRRWRFCAGFGASALCAASLSLLMVGPSQMLAYGRSLGAISLRLISAADQFKYGVAPRGMPNLRGLVYGLGNSYFSNHTIQVVTLVLSAFVFVWVAVRGVRHIEGADPLLIAITTGAAISYHFFIHDMSILLIPIIIALDRSIGAEATGDIRGRMLARSSALMFVSPICESYIPGHFYVVSLPLLLFLYALISCQTEVAGEGILIAAE